MRVNLKDFSLFFILLTPDPLQQERELGAVATHFFTVHAPMTCITPTCGMMPAAFLLRQTSAMGLILKKAGNSRLQARQTKQVGQTISW